MSDENQKHNNRRHPGNDRRELSRMDAMNDRRTGKCGKKTKASDEIANLSARELEEIIRNETLDKTPPDNIE